MPLVNGRVRLRLLEEADLPQTLAWRNQDHIRRWFLTSDVITPEQHREWFEQYRERDDDFVFLIEETITLRSPVGQAAIYRIDRERGDAEFGRMLIGDDEARGQGLAQLATDALVKWAFSDLGLREVYLDVLPDNHAARSVYERCGFEAKQLTDGILRMTKHR
jgi:RimJ/RimL family protein N-acetyltransferase